MEQEVVGARRWDSGNKAGFGHAYVDKPLLYQFAGFAVMRLNGNVGQYINSQNADGRLRSDRRNVDREKGTGPEKEKDAIAKCVRKKGGSRKSDQDRWGAKTEGETETEERKELWAMGAKRDLTRFPTIRLVSRQ